MITNRMEGSAMKADEREIRRKRRVLEHADESAYVAKTCRYFAALLRTREKIRGGKNSILSFGLTVDLPRIQISDIN